MAPDRPPSRAPTRVALVGAGFIADVHADVLRGLRGVEVAAVVDLDRGRAGRLARRAGGVPVFGDAEELLAAGSVDAVHLLVPPPLHAGLAGTFLAAGLHVLVEKPLALTAAEAESLGATAREHGVRVGVNHNLLFTPALARLRRDLLAGRLGPVDHLEVTHHMPLRQLATGRFEHFMFSSEAAILLEQAVHPFSLVVALLGPHREVEVRTGPPRVLDHGMRFVDRWSVHVRTARGTAEVSLAFGGTWPEVQLHAVGSDGSATVDLLRDRLVRSSPSRWLEAMDRAVDAVRNGLVMAGVGAAGLARYALSFARLARPADPFLESMRGSLLGFHQALREGGEVPCAASHGAAVLALCDDVAAAAGVSRQAFPRYEPPAPGPARPGEVVVTGGNGFVGRHLVARLRALDKPVTLLVRRPGVLPRELRRPELRVFSGDAGDPDDVARAAAGADALIHLATCAGDDPADVEDAMAAGVRAVAEGCRRAGVRRLVHASSTAAMALGGRRPVPDDAGPDPRPAARPPYGRGKIAAERALEEVTDLETVCLRPGIVVGEGGPPEHSGVGLWVRPGVCLGWGRGRNPLPFVLADDVAAALAAAVDRPGAAGRRYTLAGPVRLTAREWVAALQRATGRPYRYHPQRLSWTWVVEQIKFAVKRLGGRRAGRTTMRDLRSRAFTAPLEAVAAGRDLGWQPETDRARFLARALGEDVTAPPAPVPVGAVER